VVITEVYLIVGMLLVTFSIRYAMFAAAGRVEFPAYLTRALRYVPPTVLTAIIVPAIFNPTGNGIDVSLSNAYLIGGIAAGLIGWFSKNLLLTIVAGMAFFWGWQWLLSALLI
jgi:branched-subunit amino acid transport protein